MESVGRNVVCRKLMHAMQVSLSAWRAWVEIYLPGARCLEITSLSAWRAWVEIFWIVDLWS